MVMVLVSLIVESALDYLMATTFAYTVLSLCCLLLSLLLVKNSLPPLNSRLRVAVADLCIYL